MENNPEKMVYTKTSSVITAKGGSNMSFIGWIIIGALAGWIASGITGNNRRMGAVANVTVGVLGGLLGGFVMNLMGGYGINGFTFWSLLVSVIGATIFLWIANAVSGRSTVKG